MKIGFTGTRQRPTEAQLNTLDFLLYKLQPIQEFHHGDCIGADEYAHATVVGFNETNGKTEIKIVIHPPEIEDSRAFCQDGIMCEPRPYLKRNKDIVDCSDLIIAMPKLYKEEIRSGTWSTVRYARKRGKAITIIYPGGEAVNEAINII